MRVTRIVLDLVLFFYLVIGNAAVKSQEKWTLNQCISYAVKNNLDVKSNSIQNSVNKENFYQSKRDLLPYVSITGSGKKSSGRSLNTESYEYINTKSTSASIGAYTGIDIFKGFTKRNTISYKKMTYLSGLEAEKQQKYDIAFSVMNAYYNAVYYHGLIEIVKEQKELSELNLKQTQKKVNLGLKAKSDLLEMESRLSKEELTLIQTQNNYKTALLDLKQAMNLIAVDSFSIDFSDQNVKVIDGVVITPSEVYTKALAFYPSIKAKELSKDAARKNVAIAKGDLYPSLTMTGGYYSDYYKAKGGSAPSFFDQLKNKTGQYVSLSLSVPVFQKWGLRSDVKVAKLNYLQSENTYNKAKLELFNEISQNCQELESYYSEYKQLVSQEKYAGVAFEVAEKKFNQGLISIIDMYDSKNVLAQAKSDLLRTELLYVIKKKTMDYYMGKPVFEF